MKTRLATMIAGAVALWASTSSAEFMEVYGIAPGDSLNVRSGPGTNYADIGDLQPHEFVDVQGHDATGRWAQIRYRGQAAWVSAKYLRDGMRSGGAAVSTGPHVVTGIAPDDADGGLVVRQGAGRSHPSIGVLPNHSPVHVIQTDRSGNWAMISYGSGVGWVSTAYLTTVTATPQPMPSPTPLTAPDGGPLPAVFTVRGVAANDRLWVRDAPRASANALGGLRNGAVVNIDAMATADWMQITYNGQIGYLHSRYLTRMGESASSTLNGFPLGLTCHGTEPFWTLTIAPDRTVEYTSLIDGADPITSLVQTSPSIGGGYPFDFQAPPYAGALNAQACSDGMSDISYSYAITFTRPTGNGGVETLYGCCNQ